MTAVEDLDKAAVGVMVQGGEDLCERALAKWLRNAYGTDEDMRQENMARWKAIKDRVRELGRLLKRECAG